MWHGNTRLQNRHISESKHKHICLKHIGAGSGEALQEGRTDWSAVARYTGQSILAVRDAHQSSYLHFNSASSLREMCSNEPVSCSRACNIHKSGVLHSTAQSDAYVVGRMDSRVCRKLSAQWIYYRRGSIAKVPARETRMQVNRGRYVHLQGKLGYKFVSSHPGWPEIREAAGWNEATYSSGAQSYHFHLVRTGWYYLILDLFRD